MNRSFQPMNATPIARRGRPRLDANAKLIAANIRRLREGAYLQQVEVAARLGIPVSRYRHIEKQCSASIWTQYGEALARIFNNSLEAFLLDPDSVSGGTHAHDGQSADRTDDAIRLGARAAARRRELNLPGAEVARLIGVNRMTLATWESKYPFRAASDRIARWANALRVSVDWLTNADIPSPAIAESAEVVLAPSDQRTVSDEIRDIAAWLAEPIARKRKTDWSRLNPDHARNAAAFAMRYGCDGEERTLEMIGQRFGVTRERVRQVCAKMVARTSGQRFNTPVLSELIDDMQALLPATVRDLEHRFRERLGPKQSLIGAYEFSTEVLARRMFELRPNTTGHTILRDEWVACRVGEDVSGPGRLLYENSCRMIRVCGAAQAQFVFGLCARDGLVVSYPDYERLLATLPGFEWLEERTGWYWLGSFGPADNRAIFVTRKILAVAQQRVDVAEVVTALHRARRRFNVQQPDAFEVEFDAPREVILGVLRRTEGFTVLQQDDLKAAAPIPLDELAETERLMYEALLLRGGVANWADLKVALCDEQGIHPATFHMTLQTSPILTSIDFGLYKLVGHSLGADKALASIQRWCDKGGYERSGAGGQIGTKSATAEPVSVQVRVGASTIRGGYFDAPQSLCPYLDDGATYSVSGTSQQIVVSAPSGEGRPRRRVRLNGIHRIFKAMGLVAGDPVMLVLQPAARRFEVLALPTSPDSLPR